MSFEISDGAKKIIHSLVSSGFSAFICGNAVRDLLMGAVPRRYSIVTDALPEQVKRIFKNTISAKTGTVTVIENKSAYDISTFQSSGGSFVTKPEENRKYCDFTMNSVLYSPDDGIIDYFGGIEDIKNGIIRCIGDAEQEFMENPMFMLRAVRYKAELDFDIDGDTERAIRKCAIVIKKQPKDKLLKELNKLLLSNHPDYIRELHRMGIMRFILPELDKCFGEPQKNKYHIYDVGEHIMHTVMNTPPDIILRWAALLHDTGKPCCPSVDSNGIIHFYGHHRESRRISVDVLHRLRMDNDMIRDIAVLVENHDYRVDANYISVKRMMSKTGAELFEKLLMLQKADNMAKNPRFIPDKLKRINSGLDIYRDVIASGQPYRLTDLVVNERDIINLGCRKGREITDILKQLLDEVIIHPELNTRTYLFKRAKELKHRK